jgi:hypothetical protein
LLPPDRSFDGIAFTGFIPPDPNGDVGPDDYVQSVNDSFEVFDKDGNSLAGPTALSTLYGTVLPPSSLCVTSESGDPVVLYDQLADRWLISSFAFGVDANGNPVPPFEQCIAISQTADPTGGYFVYDFNVSNTKFQDYPKFGVWPVAMPGSAQGAYFMSTNQFGGTGGGGAFAFDRTEMLAGNPLTTFLYFDTGEREMLPSDLDGATPPPAGTPNFFVKFVDGSPDRLEIRSFTADFSGATSTFALTDTVSTAAFDSNMCTGFYLSEECIPQPASTTCPPPDPATGGACLASIPDRLLFRPAYRNFGSFQSLVVNHTVDVGDFADHAGIDWHELRNVGAGWFEQQEGVHSPDATHRWMGSIGMNGQQDIALGYSVSSTSISPSIRFAGREAGDPPGTLQPEATLIGGTGSQTICQPVDVDNNGTTDFCRGRWGDYSALSVDPRDDCTFWYTTEYMQPSGLWLTRIGAFRFATCVPDVLIGDVSLNEGDAGTTAFSFPVSLSRPSAFPTTVDFVTADGTATTSDGDYQASAGTVTFNPGETTKAVAIDVNGDTKFEPDEDFFVNLSNASNATIADGQGKGTILNDDPIPTISIDDVAVDEGNFGVTPATFTVSLSNPSYLAITVDFATADGTATTADGDYLATAGTLTFAPGDIVEPVAVTVNGDTTVEPDETFFVNLSNPMNATIADSQGQATIVNDDLSPNVACTITGTNKDDTLTGTPGNDVICGGNGDDTIDGLGGNDVLIGDNGQDTLLGGDGHDLLLGGNGKDDLQGGNGNDNIQGGNGADNLVGGAGSDALFGESGSDTLDTQDGVGTNDLADGGGAPDSCMTDPGDGVVSC